MKTYITMLTALCLRTPTTLVVQREYEDFHAFWYEKVAVQTDFREGPVSSFFILVPVWDVYYYLFILIFFNTVAPSVKKDCFSGESGIEPWPNN